MTHSMTRIESGMIVMWDDDYDAMLFDEWEANEEERRELVELGIIKEPVPPTNDEEGEPIPF